MFISIFQSAPYWHRYVSLKLNWWMVIAA